MLLTRAASPFTICKLPSTEENAPKKEEKENFLYPKHSIFKAHEQQLDGTISIKKKLKIYVDFFQF